MSIPRLLAGVRGDAALSAAEHEAVHGPLAIRGPELIEAVAAAGLRGRGGASFPTAVKLAAVARQPGPRSVLVNAAEGEPMSAKDRMLLRSAPHLVLDGALAAAEAVGARSVVVAVRNDAVRAHEAVARAVRERSAQRTITVVAVPAVYLAGEESALINHLNGGALKPSVVPPRPFMRGLRRRPTLVQNPETLAHIALVARHGPAWFRQVGSEAHPGTALVTVSGAVRRPEVLEIPCGLPLEAALAAAGGADEPLRAVLVGGLHGTWIGGADVAAVSLDDAALTPYGGSLAAGVLVALGSSACPVQELAQAVGWLADQSASQCGPCSNGMPALAQLLAAIAGGQAPPDAFERLRRWSGDLVGRGACHLPDGAVRLISSGARVFAGELADHAHSGPCRACRRPTTLTFGSAERAVAA